ncbi:restin homolog isoform X5 [Acanthaster planci]|uniref:Restin homolog isoform X5 n=1 Tax=Acanthaster planci TaxID=133434 RepID=A0A8B7YY91_ACAPL|nr:restin homolog isoform X5 [Acanthaster planci]
MNSSWSDQDRSRESDLTTPDSHSGTSEGEFESFEDGGHHANENNLDYEDPHSDEMDADGLQTNYNQSTEAEAGEDASNTSEHLPHPEAAGEEEAGGVREMLEDSGEALGGSGGPRTDENGEKRHTVLNMHHVDLILDNIDAELNDIINRSLNSEHSEHSYHGNSTSSGQTRSSKRSQKSAMLINSATESSDSETAEGTLEEGSATDTGLGTGSHPGDSSPLPNGENAHHRSSQNVALDRMRQNSNSKKPRKKRIPQRQVVVEFSDVDSICSEDVRMRVEETLHLQDQHNSPKYANLSNLSRGRHTAIVQSDPESIQTEEYEQRFRSLMVKQVAGVPVKSFDQVTIPSDLESVETGMVHQKFQEALRKGPEVRVFNEFGDQSDLDPLQMEEIERKFQAILRKKKIEKIRHSPKEGDTEDEGTSDLDSVRAIPSKSEAGSPPTRQSLNGRSQGRRHQNGAHIKHSGRSGDPSPRASAFNSSRSSSRVPSSPIRSQLTSPWSTPRDISPSPPTQRSPTAVGVHPHFPFGQLVAAKPCPNHEKKNPARYRLAKPYSRENDNHHPGDAARIKLESKRRKKKLLWDGRVKTSTPKANPGGRHQGDSGREMEGDVEEGTNNDHLATVRELLETETKMRRKLDELESSFEEVSSRKQDALTDLKRLREAVHRNKRDIQKAEEIARENMERADGLRSELMVLEYQRDQARRDLEDLTKSIGSIKQSQSHRGTEEVNAGTGTNLLGLSPKEVIAVIKERDELKTRLRNGEGDLSPIERSELERQLNHTKQELFSGQKSSREKLESLQEELEESRHTIEELLVEKTNLAEKVKELQATVGSEHTDGMHSDIEERNLLLEQLSGKLQKELDALRHQTHEKDQRLQSLAASVLEKDKLNDALRDQVLAAQREAEEGQRETERVVREAQGKMRNADVAKELALVELREALLREKEEEIEQLKLSLEKDKKEALTALDQKTSEMMRITQRSLSEKEEDLNVVKMQLVQHTEEANKMEQQLREQAEEQVQAAVEKERRAMEEEYTRRRREENVEKELEVAKETSRLQGELHVTKQRLEQMQTTVGVLKEELDKLREENLAAGREKVEAVSEAREKAREDIQRELDQLREQLAKENLLEADKLRMKIRQQEEEVTRLRSEVKVHQDREAKSAGVTGSKSILAEINEECKRTAAVIGSAPLKMNISRGSKSLNGTRSPKSPLHGMPDSAQGPGRTQVMAALTNLRISNEELRNYVQSLKADLERQKRALSKAQKEKDEEVKKVASTIEKKSGDMDTMRDRLIQDHLVQVEELQQQISRQRTAEASLQQRLLDKDSELKEIQQSMTQWKEETALKMAKKFEEELSKELEIRLQEASKRDGSYRGSQADLRSRNSSGNGSPSTVSSASDASTIRLLRHLQERVKQLRSENMSLRRSSRGPFESSGEERASPHSSKHSESDDKDHLLYQLQQRVKLLERQLQVAEERCRENAASVSEKISENSRLQGALTQQTKELMKMERAYSKLASPTRTPVRL